MEDLSRSMLSRSARVFGSKAISYPRPGKPLAIQTQRDGSRWTLAIGTKRTSLAHRTCLLLGVKRT